MQKFKKKFWKKEFDCNKCKATFKFFFQHFWLFYALLVTMTACNLHFKCFPYHQEPQQPQWPLQPQWPQWPQWPKQPHFIKTLTEDDVAINLATKWPILVSQCGMNCKKSTILWIFGTLSGLRLWRTGMLFSTKSKCHKSNVRIS